MLKNQDVSAYRCRSMRNVSVLTVCLVSVTGLGLLTASTMAAEGGSRAASPRAIEVPTEPTLESRVLEDGTIVRKTSKFEVRITPLHDAAPQEVRSERDDAGGMAASVCPTVVQSYSNVDFEGTNIPLVLQGGFVETEIAAAQYFPDPDSFPIKVDMAEKIFATTNTSVTTTTEWSIQFWAGPPGTGDLIDEFSSDDKILPHIVIPPGTNAVNVQVIVDPDDPDQIIIPSNSSNSLTIGFRIDSHNNPPTTSCPCQLGGSLPAVCCPPDTSSNAFPTTDPSGMTNAAANWLFARDCPGAGFFCFAAPAGWYNFTTSGLPTGDWNIRATYTGLNCPEGFGACCLPAGNCQILGESTCDDQNGIFQGENVTCTSVECEAIGACCYFDGPVQLCDVMTLSDCTTLPAGNYQGDGTVCANIECPFLLGGCCLGDGQCEELFIEECEDADGVWLGGGSDCGEGACDGACCVEATGACVDFDEATCGIVDGIWQGPGTVCEGFVCFPAGACCLPDGSCEDDLSPEECEDLEGDFQGDGSLCEDANCPEPIGACCLANGNCLELIETTCLSVAGDWQGPGTNCDDTSDSGVADACEDPAPACPADITGDGVVDGADLLELLSQWGPCDDPNNCPGDINGDGVVDGADLLELLSQWGPCP